MINDSKNTMMGGAPKQKTVFHFSGDGIYWAKAILAETIEEAERIWHETKQPISKTTLGPEIIVAPPERSKVEDSKPTDIE